ncbi:MAG: glycosyltransferase [Ignavibacteriaceae bacterium]|nr:glycosyltransferase [Ignavibacteriaceae bacterium]
MKKKIILIGSAYPYRGGNALFIMHVYEALSQKFDAKIFNYKLMYPPLLFPGKTQYDVSEKPVKSSPNERLINTMNPFNWYNVAKRIIKENPDLVVFNWWHPYFGLCHRGISSLIKGKFKGKIVFITENFISHEANFLDRFLTKYGLKHASAFVALSDIVNKELATISEGRPVYRSELPIFDFVDVGLNPEKSKLREEFKIGANDKVILFFGYVRHYKGLDILLEAMPAILEFDPNIKLFIAGEFYDEYQKYSDLIEKLKISGSIIMQNLYIPNEEVYKYYLISDLVILPYRSATQSGILNIAYGFNKPALVTKVGGLAEFVDDNETGVIVEPGSANEIANGVKKFYELEKSVNFEENIKMKVNSNSFNKFPELFEEILKDLKL